MDLDFSKIKYNVHSLSTTDKCIEKYKDLQIFADVFDREDDLPEGVSSDFALRYLILTYTPSSPFVEVYTDLPKRKLRVLEYLGIPQDKEIPDPIKEMCSLKSAPFIFRWVCFMRIQSNEVWASLCTVEERLYSALAKYVDVHNDPQKAKNENDVVKEIVNQIRNLKKEFLAGEKSKEAEEAISFSITNESLKIRPEEYIPIYAAHKKISYGIERL